MIKKEVLLSLYLDEKLSMMEISKALSCSVNQVSYWMNKYSIKRRSISEGVYIRSNPDGDPFLFSLPKNRQEFLLFGLGLGLYWVKEQKQISILFA